MENTRVSEQRGFERFKTDLPAVITCLVYSRYAYMLYRPFDVRVVNVSRSGMRLSAQENAFMLRCCFSVCFKIREKDTELLAEVINMSPAEGGGFEYGCRFYSRNKPMQRVVL